LICIEVVVSHPQVHKVAPVLVKCCSLTGDRLLGGRVDAETEEVVFLIQLTQDPHLSSHLSVLGDALQQGLIAAFHFSQGSVIKLNAPGICDYIRKFPFSLGDSWVPGLRNLQDVYLCVCRPLLTGRQAAWLHLQDNLRWEYV
jgi:hypothetical protein